MAFDGEHKIWDDIDSGRRTSGSGGDSSVDHEGVGNLNTGGLGLDPSMPLKELTGALIQYRLPVFLRDGFTPEAELWLGANRAVVEGEIASIDAEVERLKARRAELRNTLGKLSTAAEAALKG